MTTYPTTSDPRPGGPVAGPGPGAGPVAPGRGVLRPLGLQEVRITGGTWGEHQAVNATATLGHVEHWLEREGWLGNFDAAVEGRLPHDRRGREFSDSEVYKLLEALAWEHGRTGDPDVDRRLRAVVARVAAVQEPDGYLNTYFGRPGQQPRWSDLEWGHELYCVGHLVQAAVARARTVGLDDDLVRVARRAADLVCDTFGPDGIDAVCGHPEIEPALVELHRVTGERRYLEQAGRFLARRGRPALQDVEFGRAYFQDDVPVREAEVLRGHAVRATYLAAGAVDHAVETSDLGMLDAVDRQWRATVARRTYLTGGMGSRHQDEAFGDDHVLPADRAYAETCAGIGSVMLGWRLLLARGNPEYADLVERTLYNVLSAAVSADGTRFFYTNTLHQRVLGSVPEPDRAVARASSTLRAPWFGVSCCPTNVARTVASLAAYLATTDDDGLQLHQYAPAQIRTRLPDGADVAVDVETDYPRSGRVLVRVVDGDVATWTLSLRVPSWASGAVLVADGERRVVGTGTVRVRREFRPGDVVELELPTEPRFTRPDRRIDAVRGCVAVERGPEVLCLESPDVPGAPHVDTLVVDDSVPPREVDGRVLVRLRRAPDTGLAWPYPTTTPGATPPVTDTADTDDTEDSWADVPLLPYRHWAERGPSTMRVWIPTG